MEMFPSLLDDFAESKVLGLDSIFPMGKHKGITVREYIDNDPLSLNWYVEKEIVTLSSEASHRLNEELRDAEKARGDTWENDAIFNPLRYDDLPF
jgi:hypothetical protein